MSGDGLVEQKRARDRQGGSKRGKWSVRDGALYCEDGSGARRLVSSTAPLVVANVHYQDEGKTLALVRMRIGGRCVEAVADRAELFSATKIVGLLAPLGANVSSTNAREIVQFMTCRDAAVGQSLPVVEGTSHLGWVGREGGPFAPYEADGLRVDAPRGMERILSSLAKPKGTLRAWTEAVGPAREQSMALRAMLAASFASPLVGILGLQPFVCYLWGGSGSGKTASLRVAGSVWGDAGQGGDYYQTFANTKLSTMRIAAFLHDVPLLLDDLQSLGAADRDKRRVAMGWIYDLSLGHERTTLRADRSMRPTGSWSLVTIATGEVPILDRSTQQGALNRTLELCAEPFSDRSLASSLHRLSGEQYGTAGRAYVRLLRATDDAILRSMWDRVRDECGSLAPDARHADQISLLCLADMISRVAVFDAGAADWGNALEDAGRLARWVAGNVAPAEELDTDRNAIAHVSEWLTQSERLFDDGSGLVDEPVGVVEGSRRPDGTVYYVFKGEFEGMLAEAGFDAQKTLRRMRDEGIARCGRGRLYFQKRVRGNQTYTACISKRRLEEFLVE
ncbi:MAG: DUF927 domain-containing protein [Coriobacteriales bacterium]|nr:DUF927 domain-containing protein [Coriobacteriales bacterium]